MRSRHCLILLAMVGYEHITTSMLRLCIDGASSTDSDIMNDGLAFTFPIVSVLVLHEISSISLEYGHKYYFR